ncbi:HEAT repeat domain-containing protein [Candidatus Micrarchaeota archaeon]|nr:HEAT repeat domain-containing protein [Candidatus Micrarchaeota archaeon]
MGVRKAAPQMQVSVGKLERIRQWWRRRKVDGCLDLDEKKAAKKLAKMKFPPLQYLIESVVRMDEKSGKAAYLIGKRAENGADCREAVMPLYGLLQEGDDLQKGNSAVALARIWTEESISKLVAALNDKNHISRRFAAVGLGMAGVENPLAMRALKKAAESDCDPEVRKLAQNALRQIAELQ